MLDKERSRCTLLHLVENVLGCTTDSHLFRALEEKGVTTIEQFMTAPDHVITNLAYTNKMRKFFQFPYTTRNVFNYLENM